MYAKVEQNPLCCDHHVRMYANEVTMTLYGQHHQNEYERHCYDARLKDLT